MKLKAKKKLVINKEPEEKKEVKKSKRDNTLPSDAYKPLIPPKRILVREFPQKNSAKMGKLYLEISVKRYGEDIENAPEVYLLMSQATVFYA